MAFLNTLKTQTADQHTALEAQMDLSRHFNSEQSYRCLLIGFYRVYAPLEVRLGKAVNWQELGWDFEGRKKTPWLVEDLISLGMSQEEVDALPISQDLPEITSLAQALGCLYVLEGSTLGGQFITKVLQKSLPITSSLGGRFFAGYREQTLPQWRAFGQWAEAQATLDPSLEAKAVVTAQQTFDSFAKELNF
jgi:heme oxygenase